MEELTNAMVARIKEIGTKDEAQIMADLACENVREMVYTVEVKDRKTGKYFAKHKLSWAGTKEAARYRGNIVVDDIPNVTDLEDSIRVVVRVTDLTRNLSIFGGCHQPKHMKVYDRENDKALDSFHYENDDYAFQKALAKAQRNAICTILPADHLARCIDRFLRAGEKVKQISAGNQKVIKNSVEVKEEDIKTLYDAERAVYNKYHMQPAEFYKQIGYAKRDDVTESPLACYLKIKAIMEN